METEIFNLDLKYKSLRIEDCQFLSKLLSSISQVGQQVPVLVVQGESEQIILIDGYHRVKALKKLGEDMVMVLEYPGSEEEALVFSYRSHHNRERSAFEDAWFLDRLQESYGYNLSELSRLIGKSKSWSSRRLDLINILSLEVQELVRKGQICSHAAMKYLVPLARANKNHCNILSKNICGLGLSSREVESLYKAWRKSTKEQKERLVESPKLYLKANAQSEADENDKSETSSNSVIRQLNILKNVSYKTIQVVNHELNYQGGLSSPDVLQQSWKKTQTAFTKLSTKLEEELNDRP